MLTVDLGSTHTFILIMAPAMELLYEEFVDFIVRGNHCIVRKAADTGSGSLRS